MVAPPSSSRLRIFLKITLAQSESERDYFSQIKDSSSLGILVVIDGIQASDVDWVTESLVSLFTLKTYGLLLISEDSLFRSS